MKLLNIEFDSSTTKIVNIDYDSYAASASFTLKMPSPVHRTTEEQNARQVLIACVQRDNLSRNMQMRIAVGISPMKGIKQGLCHQSESTVYCTTVHNAM